MPLNCHKPLVSIIVPVYNTELYIRQCIDSILSQTYTNLQIVLIDDGSRDNSGCICEEYALKDQRIEYIKGGHNGIAGVRNQLLRAAKGEYILFVDSDDWIEPHTIECCLSAIESLCIDILIFNRAGSDNKHTPLKVLNRKQAISTFLEEGSLPSNLWLKFVRSGIYRDLGFDEDILYGEDVMMTWKLINKAECIALAPTQLYHYRNNPDSMTNGYYSDATMSLCKVWERIVADCRSRWPEYLQSALDRQLYCHIWILYTAIRSGERNNPELQSLQRQVRTGRKQIPNLPISLKAKAFTYASAYAYTLTRIALSPRRKRLNPLR